MKNFKSLYGFGGRCLKIRDVCMNFEPYCRPMCHTGMMGSEKMNENLVSAHPKSIILGQTSLILRQRPPKPYKPLKFFISFVTTVKSRHAPTI